MSEAKKNIQRVSTFTNSFLEATEKWWMWVSDSPIRLPIHWTEPMNLELPVWPIKHFLPSNPGLREETPPSQPFHIPCPEKVQHINMLELSNCCHLVLGITWHESTWFNLANERQGATLGNVSDSNNPNSIFLSLGSLATTKTKHFIPRLTMRAKRINLLGQLQCSTTAARFLQWISSSEGMDLEGVRLCCSLTIVIKIKIYCACVYIYIYLYTPYYYCYHILIFKHIDTYWIITIFSRELLFFHRKHPNHQIPRSITILQNKVNGSSNGFHAWQLCELDNIPPFVEAYWTWEISRPFGWTFPPKFRKATFRW